jgi:NAD(P)-dependent dehydrogenase (short-subunit alcohol dehydrogenase family)
MAGGEALGGPAAGADGAPGGRGKGADGAPGGRGKGADGAPGGRGEAVGGARESAEGPRTVLVAGASRGIGAAIALAFADAEPVRLVLAGRTERDLQSVAEAARERGSEAEVGVADLTDAAQARELACRAGSIDVLVVNAGVNQPEPFLDVTEETFDRLFALNVRAGFFLAQAAAPAMPRGGCIVFISSQMGHVGAVERTVYCATKHALEGLTKALALELAPRGVRAVTVGPTFVHTALTAHQLDDREIGPRLRAQIPLDRFATPEEVAGAVVWIASPQAAMVTGSALLVDGGWTAR